MNSDGFDNHVDRLVQTRQENVNVVEGLRLLTAFQNITDLTDRGILIDLAERLASRTTNPMTAS